MRSNNSKTPIIDFVGNLTPTKCDILREWFKVINESETYKEAINNFILTEDIVPTVIKNEIKQVMYPLVKSIIVSNYNEEEITINGTTINVDHLILTVSGVMYELI